MVQSVSGLRPPDTVAAVLAAIKRASRPSVALDCEAWIEAKAEEADAAAASGDHRTDNVITRLLSGKAFKKEAVAVKDKEGNLVSKLFAEEQKNEDMLKILGYT